MMSLYWWMEQAYVQQKQNGAIQKPNAFYHEGDEKVE